jgi:hypothetical protein
MSEPAGEEHTMRASRRPIHGLVWVAATVTLVACAKHPAPEAAAPPPSAAVASSPEITNEIEPTRAAIQARRQALPGRGYQVN